MSAPAANLRRLMAQHGLTVARVAQKCGLDERTIRGILNGSKPHARSIHKLATGFGVSTDELFLDTSLLVRRRSDRQTNPAVDEVISEHPDLFDGWTEADFYELYSRVSTADALTTKEALEAVEAVQAMNAKRLVHEKADLLLESGEAEVPCGIVNLLHRKAVLDGD